MTVYVDGARLPLGRMRMSHMLADTAEELHAMAAQLGLRREWFQVRASTPHYDVCEANRRRAIALGAVPVDRRGMVAVVRRLRDAPCRRCEPGEYRVEQLRAENERLRAAGDAAQRKCCAVQAREKLQRTKP